MILARLSQAIRAQNWFAVALEFVIVVAGVLLAFQISAWAEANANRALAGQSLVRLADDLRAERANWLHTLAYYQQTRSHTLRALEAFLDTSEEVGAEFLTDLYQASQQWNVTARTGAYDELIATGRVVYIADEATRALISNHYERTGARSLTLRDPSGYREIIRSHMDERIQQQIRARCGDAYITDENNYVFLSLPTDCDIDLDPGLLAREADRLRTIDDIRQALRFHLAILDSRTGTIENGVLTTETTLAAIRETAR